MSAPATVIFGSFQTLSPLLHWRQPSPYPPILPPTGRQVSDFLAQSQLNRAQPGGKLIHFVFLGGAISCTLLLLDGGRQRREIWGFFNALLSDWLTAYFVLGRGVLSSLRQSCGPQVRKTKCTHRGTRGSNLCHPRLIHSSKGFLEPSPPTPRVCLQLINYLMERLRLGPGKEILTENQSEMKINDFQKVPVGQ